MEANAFCRQRSRLRILVPEVQGQDLTRIPENLLRTHGILPGPCTLLCVYAVYYAASRTSLLSSVLLINIHRSSLFYCLCIMYPWRGDWASCATINHRYSHARVSTQHSTPTPTIDPHSFVSLTLGALHNGKCNITKLADKS